jgi:hypothetical protein
MKGNDIGIGIAVLLGIWAMFGFLTSITGSDASLLQIPGTGETSAIERGRRISPSPVNTSETSQKQQTEARNQTNKTRRNIMISTVRAKAPADEDESQPENEEYIILEADNDNTSAVSITGWTLTSSVTGTAATIGQASVLGPASFKEQSVTLSPGGEAIVVTGESPDTGVWPHGGTSFRVTKCSEYLTNYAEQFSPHLSTDCPDPTERAPDHLKQDRACEEVLDDADSCNIPEVIPARISNECRTWIRENVGINACRKYHRTDQNFLTNEWRLFLDRSRPMWREAGDTIELRDTQGNVRDTK